MPRGFLDPIQSNLRGEILDTSPREGSLIRENSGGSEIDMKIRQKTTREFRYVSMVDVRITNQGRTVRNLSGFRGMASDSNPEESALGVLRDLIRSEDDVRSCLPQYSVPLESNPRNAGYFDYLRISFSRRTMIANLQRRRTTVLSPIVKIDSGIIMESGCNLVSTCMRKPWFTSDQLFGFDHGTRH